MGTIDQSTHTFTCPICKMVESVRVYEKGSNWGASWQEAPETKHFAVQWEANQFGEPRPISMKCIPCGYDVKCDSR
jgi:hypothetical protein